MVEKYKELYHFTSHGLDVSKGKSQVQAFLDKGKPYRKSFSIDHNLEGLENLLEFLQEVEKLAGSHQPSVVLESTGHYHSPVLQFLEEKKYVYIIVNPLISHRAKSSSLRKVKTTQLMLISNFQLKSLFSETKFILIGK